MFFRTFFDRPQIESDSVSEQTLTRPRYFGATLALADACLVLVSLLAAYGLIWFVDDTQYSRQDPTVRILYVYSILLSCQIASMYVLGLYGRRSTLIRWRYGALLFVSVVLAAGCASAFLFFVPDYIIGRRPLILYTVVLLFLLWTCRYAVTDRILSGSEPKSLAVFGRPEDIKSIADLLRDKSPSGYSIRRAISGPTGTRPNPECGCDTLERSRQTDGLSSVLDDRRVDMVALDIGHAELDGDAHRKLVELSLQGVELRDVNDFFQSLAGHIRPEDLNNGVLLRSVVTRDAPNKYYWELKRLLDLSIAVLGLVATSWLMLIIALAVKIDSPGPALFIQERLGYKKRPFRCIKFRTMIDGAEQKTGPAWSSTEDPRVTRVGKFLRQTRLDELPQFINVLKGEMALVGPRPIRKHFADMFAADIPLYDLRFCMRPGITGWAQINYGYAGSVEEQKKKFCYDMYYLKKYSLIFDVVILLRTARVILGRGGI